MVDPATVVWGGGVLRRRDRHLGGGLLHGRGEAQGSAGRAAARRARTRPAGISDEVDSARAAAFLGVSHQHVRRLLKAVTEYQQGLAPAEPDEVVLESHSLPTAQQEMVTGQRML